MLRIDYRKELKFMKKSIKILAVVVIIMLTATALCLPCVADKVSTGDVAGAIESTWNDASSQIKTVVNEVVFPIIDLILGVFFFIKLALSYFDFKKHGAFEWQGPAILFACLVLALTAPLYVWGIVGM